MGLSENTSSADTAFFNQFLLSDKEVSELNRWNITHVGEYLLYTHPALEVSLKKSDSGIFIILGYWYDFRKPSHSNQEIVDQLNIDSTISEMMDQLQYMSGVYCIIWKRGEEILLIPDLCALREVYIDNSEENSIVAGSTPNILGLIRTTRRDVNSFYKSDVFRKRFLWVGNQTCFHNITRLSPNHYYNLHTGLSVRFLPL
jgi:hypothetical protein